MTSKMARKKGPFAEGKERGKRRADSRGKNEKQREVGVEGYIMGVRLKNIKKRGHGV